MSTDVQSDSVMNQARAAREYMLECRTGGTQYQPMGATAGAACVLCGMRENEHLRLYLRPRCQHCGGDGTRIAAMPLQLGPLVGSICWCMLCGWIVKLDIAGVQQQQSPIAGPDGGRLIRM